MATVMVEPPGDGEQARDTSGTAATVATASGDVGGARDGAGWDVTDDVVREGSGAGGTLSPRNAVGLGLAPLAFAAIVWGPMPAGVGAPMRAAAGLTAAMAVLWVCESLPLAVTALLPLVVLPMFGVAAAGEVAANYANDLIFLFIGGFILANAVEQSGLHRRVALGILARTGTGKRRLVLAMMAVTAFVSLWISNTATAVLLMPVGLSVLAVLAPDDRKFGAALVLGIAAACTIGGMGTPMGSTPNMLFVSLARRLYGIDVGFFHWSAVGLPLAVAFTLIAWWLLAFVTFPLPGTSSPQADRLIAEQRAGLGRVRGVEVAVGVVFGLTALAWVVREPWVIGGHRFGLNVIWPRLTDGIIAVAGAVAMFLIPVRLGRIARGRTEFLLTWKTGGKLPWDVVLLFGGGLAMADGLQRSGLDRLLVQSVSGLSGAVPGWVLVLLVCVLCVVLSEVASNTATAALLLPLSGTMAAGLGREPMFLMLPVAFATSLGLMLPAATPPNALALASGHVTIGQMVRIGLLLNIVGVVLIMAGCYLIGYPVFASGR